MGSLSAAFRSQKLPVSIYSCLTASDCHESLAAAGPNGSNDDQQSFNDRLFVRLLHSQDRCQRVGDTLRAADTAIYDKRVYRLYWLDDLSAG